jgi:hypothetical protein
MITELQKSTLRLAAGGVMLAATLAIVVFLLPDASRLQAKEEHAARDAKQSFEVQKKHLGEIQDRATWLKRNQDTLKGLLDNMPAESVGRLQWRLSTTLYAVAAKHGVRLQAVKYGTASREGAKGANLESLDVEFSVTGTYQDLKPFMLSLEGSKLPFAVTSAKLEESPEGGHLTVVLRAFRQPSVTSTPEPAGEEA